MNFLFLVMLKYSGLLAFWMNILPMHDFMTSCSGFGKYWFTELWRFFEFCHILLYRINKITSINGTINLIRKVHMCWEAIKFIVVDTALSNFSILIFHSNFIFNNKYQLFSLKWQAHFIILKTFSRKHLYVKFPSLNDQSLHFMKKKIS